MSDLRDLIEKLETATEGSRELDADIVEALWPVTVDRSAHDWGVWREQAVVLGGERTTIDCFDRVKPYTASLDAALSLVPEGWEWLASNRAPEPHAGRAYLHNRKPRFLGLGAAPNPEHLGVEVTAHTSALALCIAALRAREAQS